MSDHDDSTPIDEKSRKQSRSAKVLPINQGLPDRESPPVEAYSTDPRALEAATDRGKPRLINVRELCSLPPAESWIIKRYIPSDSLGAIFGDPETGKSFAMIDLACHVAIGRHWRGMATRSGLVVYVAGEGRNGLAKRFKAWFEHHDEDPRNIYLSSIPIELTNLVSVTALIEEIKKLPTVPVLVLVDTLNRNFGSGDENSTADMTMAVAGMDFIRTTIGATTIASHHSGHVEKGRGRGSSVLRASLDFEYGIERIDRTVQLRCTKAKDIDCPPPLAWTLEQQPLPWCDEDGVPLSSAVLVPTESAPNQAERLGKYERLAFDLLDAHFKNRDMEEQIEDVTQCHGVPVTKWRAEFKASLGDVPDNTKRQAWKRTIDSLTKGKNLVVLVETNDEELTLAWPAYLYRAEWHDSVTCVTLRDIA